MGQMVEKNNFTSLRFLSSDAANDRFGITLPVTRRRGEAHAKLNRWKIYRTWWLCVRPLIAHALIKIRRKKSFRHSRKYYNRGPQSFRYIVSQSLDAPKNTHSDNPIQFNFSSTHSALVRCLDFVFVSLESIYLLTCPFAGLTCALKL